MKGGITCRHRGMTAVALAAMTLALLLSASAIAQEEPEFTAISSIEKESGISRVDKIDMTVDSTGFVTVEEDMSLNETLARILIPLVVDNLAILDSKGNELGYELEPSEDLSGQFRYMTLYLKSPEEKSIKVSYSTQSLTKKSGSLWTVLFYSMTTSRSTIIRISFPENVNVTSFRSNQTVYLYPPDLKSPLFLYPQDNYISFEFDYRLKSEQPPTNGFDINDFLAYIIVIAIIIAVVVLRIVSSNRKLKKRIAKEESEKAVVSAEEGKTRQEKKKSGSSRKKKRSAKAQPDSEKKEEKSAKEGRKVKESVVNMLDENEREVIRMLEDSDIEITQAYIYKTLGIPKASLSNIIKRLEQRNLIEKTKEGRINWIKLKEWVFE